jgi:adenosylmethionine-8-amino-7-oxononanoate aminotransferase
LIFQKRGVRNMLNTIRLVPPMTMTNKELDQGLSILADAIKKASKLSTIKRASIKTKLKTSPKH